MSVVLSQGPQPRVVPDLTGMSIDQATAALAAADLCSLRSIRSSATPIAVGLIVAQDLAPNTNVDRGATVSVAVSKGPDVVAVVPLANLTLQQATDTLTAAGLALGTVSGNPDGVLVAAQYQGVDMLPGQLLPRGSAIDITLA